MSICISTRKRKSYVKQSKRRTVALQNNKLTKLVGESQNFQETVITVHRKKLRICYVSFPINIQKETAHMLGIVQDTFS